MADFENAGGSRLKSANSMANENEKKLRPISYVATFLSELIGTMWLVFILGALTAWWRAMPGSDYTAFLLQGVIGAFIITTITAVAFRTSAIFNFTGSLAGAIMMMLPVKWWPNAYVPSPWFAHYTGGSSSRPISNYPILLKLLVEWSGQLGGSIAGAALVYLIMPSSVPLAVHLCGQPQVTGGVNTTEALFTDIFLGGLFKWALLVAYGVTQSRIMDDLNRSYLLALAFGAARAIAAFTTQSSFNFWVYFGAAVFAGFHSDWWIWFVGDICSTLLALIVYYLVSRESNSEISRKNK